MEHHSVTKYSLSEDEIRDAIYSLYVHKFKASGIQAFFEKNHIDIYEDGGIRADLTITENKKIE